MAAAAVASRPAAGLMKLAGEADADGGGGGALQLAVLHARIGLLMTLLLTSWADRRFMRSQIAIVGMFKLLKGKEVTAIL